MAATQSQFVLNNPDNVAIASGVSVWFKENFVGEYKEMGDVEVSGVTLNPEFQDYNSNRNGIRSLVKKILTKKAGTISFKTNEPTILNLQRAAYGGSIDSANANTTDLYDGRLMQLAGTAGAFSVDFSKVAEGEQCTFDDLQVYGVFGITDAEFSTNLISGTITPNASTGVASFGTELFGTTKSYALAAGDWVYVAYKFPFTDALNTEIFGATNCNIQGSAKLQIRNQNGGVVQLWDLASVQISPNGELGMPQDAIQSIPMVMTLLERSGSFGRIFTR
jgi:hypothetical protein